MKLTYDVVNILSSAECTIGERIEFWICLDGSAKITINEKAFLLDLNDMLLIPAGSPVLLTCTVATRIGRISAEDIHYLSNNKPVHTPGKDTWLIRELFSIAIELSQKKLPHQEQLNTAFDNLMHASMISANLVSGRQNPVIVAVINDILDQAFDPDFDLNERITQTGYTPNYFRRIFKQETGVPPLEFMNNIRLDHAKELLIRKDTKTPFGDIALECGCRDVYYFSRLFKKYTGYTPKEYIRLYHEWNTEI